MEMEKPNPIGGDDFDKDKIKIDKKIAIVDVSGAVEARARDVADANLTASKEKTKGIRGFFYEKIWRQNLAKEYYRRLEINKARAAILESGNLFVGEEKEGELGSHNEEMGAVVKQYTDEYEGLIHEEAGEKKEILGESEPEKSIKARIQQLIKDYATGAIDEAAFKEEKNRAFSEIRGVKHEVIDKGSMYADNLFEVAEQVKEAIAHHQKMEDLDLDFQVVVGRAKMDVRTEAQFNAIDRLTEKITSTKVGNWVGETTVSSGLSIVYSIAGAVSKRFANSRLASWGSFGATAALGAGIAGLRESKRLEEEKRQHFREMAQGEKFNPDRSPRRKEIEEFRYETRNANDLRESLEQGLYTFKDDGTKEVKDLSQEELQAVLGNLAEIESRIKLSDRQKIDLVSYSDSKKVAQERLALDIARAEAKVNLKRLFNRELKITEKGKDFSYKIKGLVNSPDILNYINSPEFQNETDIKKKHDLLAYWLSERRLEKGFKIGDIDKVHVPFTPESTREYANWDWYRTGEALKEFDLSKGKEKILGENLKIPDGKTLTEFLDSLSETRIAQMISGDQGIEAKNALFKEMKHKKVAYAVLKGLATGLIIGGVAQEAMAFLREGQEGLVEGLIKGYKEVAGGGMAHYTPLEALRRWWSGDFPKVEPGNLHEMVLDQNHFKLPEGVELVRNPDGGYNLTRGGDILSEGIEINPDGSLTEEGRRVLEGDGVTINSSVEHLAHTSHESAGLSPQEYIDQHENLFHKVKRLLWYDNETPKPVFDKNEQALTLGGIRGTGIDQKGDFIYSVKKMLPDGSYHGKFSADAHELAKQGKLKLLFTLFKGNQSQVIEVPIDENFNAVIDHDSEVGKLVCENANGQLKQLARFAEVAEIVDNKDGVDQIRILATSEGVGIDKIPGIIPKDEIVDIPFDQLTPPADYRIDPPPFIPIFGRGPLEPTERFPKQVYYGAGSAQEILGEFKRRNIKPDPYRSILNKEGKLVLVDKDGKEIIRDADREKQRINDYLNNENPDYLNELNELNKNLQPMHEKCRVCVTIPARLEEKNIANLLEQYSKQVDENNKPLDPELYEINIIVNKKKSEVGDKTMEEIEKWKRKNPEINVNAIDITFDDKKGCVGLARKYITDLSLLRSVLRQKQSRPLYMESEDADLFGVDKRTISKLIKDFDKNSSLDVLRGIQDRQPEIMQKNDLLFFSRRLWDFMEVFLRNQKYRPENNPQADFTWHRVVSGGWNTAYTAEVYAQIGGYNLTRVIGEDMEIGQKISVLRGSKDAKDGRFVPNTHTARASGLRGSSSPRRFINALAKRMSPYEDFDNQALKKMTLDQLLDQIKEYSEADQKHLPKFQEELDILAGFFKNSIFSGSPKWQEIMRRSLTLGMGLKEKEHYDLTADGVTLTSKGMQRIIDNLKEYKTNKRWKLGYARQNAPAV